MIGWVADPRQGGQPGQHQLRGVRQDGPCPVGGGDRRLYTFREKLKISQYQGATWLLSKANKKKDCVLYVLHICRLHNTRIYIYLRIIYIML